VNQLVEGPRLQEGAVDSPPTGLRRRCPCRAAFVTACCLGDCGTSKLLLGSAFSSRSRQLRLAIAAVIPTTVGVVCSQELHQGLAGNTWAVAGGLRLPRREGLCPFEIERRLAL